MVVTALLLALCFLLFAAFLWLGNRSQRPCEAFWWYMCAGGSLLVALLVVVGTFGWEP